MQSFTTNNKLGWRAKIGLVIPSNNTVIEPEINAMLPDGVSLHAARVLSFGSTPDGIREMEQSAERALGELRAGRLTVLVYACLATSLVKGREWTEAFGRRISALEGCALTTAAEATLSAIGALGTKRLAIGTAYPAAVNAYVAEFFASYGFEIVSLQSLNVRESLDLWCLTPDAVASLGRSAFVRDAEALCFLGTDIPTAGVVAALEAEFGVPVFSTNQAILWRALTLCGVDQPIVGHGLLLEKTRVSS